MSSQQLLLLSPLESTAISDVLFDQLDTASLLVLSATSKRLQALAKDTFHRVRCIRQDDPMLQTMYRLGETLNQEYRDALLNERHYRSEIRIINNHLYAHSIWSELNGQMSPHRTENQICLENKKRQLYSQLDLVKANLNDTKLKGQALISKLVNFTKLFENLRQINFGYIIGEYSSEFMNVKGLIKAIAENCPKLEKIEASGTMRALQFGTTTVQKFISVHYAKELAGKCQLTTLHIDSYLYAHNIDVAQLFPKVNYVKVCFARDYSYPLGSFEGHSDAIMRMVQRAALELPIKTIDLYPQNDCNEPVIAKVFELVKLIQHRIKLFNFYIHAAYVPAFESQAVQYQLSDLVNKSARGKLRLIIETDFAQQLMKHLPRCCHSCLEIKQSN